MLLNSIWYLMISVSLLYGMLTGQGKEALPALLAGTAEAVAVSLKLASGYLLFCGLMNIVNNLKTMKTVENALKPALTFLVGRIDHAGTREAVSMNLSANLLGLGNAATPSGIEAARQLDAQNNRHALYMLLIINATSIQLLPTTVLTLRIAAGSAQPNAIIWPTIAATAASTVVGCGLGRLCQLFSGGKA